MDLDCFNVLIFLVQKTIFSRIDKLDTLNDKVFRFILGAKYFGYGMQPK